jgi:hypothetical protein
VSVLVVDDLEAIGARVALEVDGRGDGVVVGGRIPGLRGGRGLHGRISLSVLTVSRSTRAGDGIDRIAISTLVPFRPNGNPGAAA